MLSLKKETTKKHQKFDKRKIMAEDGFIHSVRIYWKSNQTITNWNETCADVIEVFGLPGDRFMSHPTFEYMDIVFKSPRDAELCKILISEKML